jgi:hypothetical protein
MGKEAAVEYFITESEYVFRNVVEIEEIHQDSRSSCENQTSSFRRRRADCTSQYSLSSCVSF